MSIVKENGLISQQYPILLFVETVCKSKWKSLRDNYRREYKKLLKNQLYNKKYKSGWMHFYHLKFLEQVLDVKQIQNQILMEHSKDSSGDFIKDEMEEESEEIQEQNGYDDLNEDLDSEGMLTGLDAYNSYQIRSTDDENYDQQYDSNNWNDYTEDEEKYEIDDIEEEKPASTSNKYDVNQYIAQQQRQLLAQKRHVKETPSSTADDDVTHFFKSLIPFMRMMDPAKKLKVRLEIQELILNELTKLNSKKRRKGDTTSSLGDDDDIEEVEKHTKRHKTDTGRRKLIGQSNGKTNGY